MSLFDKRYIVKDSKGGRKSLTAKKLYNQVSNYGLIAPATELLRVCKEPDFPVEYAQGIQIMILIHFTNLENNKIPQDGQYPIEVTAVNSCYNSLADVSEEASKVRNEYLWAVIKNVARYHFSPNSGFNHYHGSTYCNIRRKWEVFKFEQYCSMPKLDLEKLCEELNKSFNRTMKSAERKGAFHKDDEQWRKRNDEQLRETIKEIHGLQDFEGF